MKSLSTKSGFFVNRMVDIPENYLLPNVRKALSRREMFKNCDDELTETIYNGDVFTLLANEQNQLSTDSAFKMDAFEFAQIQELAKDLEGYEMVRLVQD